MANLILGLAAGYHFGDVRPFLSSLNAVGNEAQVVLFTSGTTRDIDRMRDHGATVVPFSRPADQEHIPYNGYRYFLYKDWLESSGQTFDRVLMADVRDVVFQRDPFSFAWTKGLNVTLEDRRATIGKCPYNSHWMRGHFGDDMVERLGDYPISCSGTTVADSDALHAYLDLMTESLARFQPAERMAGYDQAIHNVLIHTGRMDATQHDNTGPILTLGQTVGEPAMDGDDVLNGSGEPAVIVHQHDRKPLLFKRIRQTFAD